MSSKHKSSKTDLAHRSETAPSRLRIVATTDVEPPEADTAVVAGVTDVGALGQMTGYALRRAQISVFEDFIATIAETGLRPAQFSVLVLLDQTPGLTQSAVAAALGIQRANFVTLINELERRGLARREPSLTDRRSYALQLTDKGRTTLKRARELHALHEARVREAVGAENVETLLALLSRLGPGLRR